jgi:two-component system copper resistance phosphate regulon response regulator CusR
MLGHEIVMENLPHSFAHLRKRGQLLVVDDNEGVQEVLSKDLSFLGYEVTLADDGLEAATLFLTVPYDLVITDLRMPVIDGCELSRLVKEKSPDTPVVVIAGFGDNKQWENLNLNYVDAIIMKPFKLEEIETTVQMLLNSEA